MHRSEATFALTCLDCGGEIFAGTDREYAVTDDLWLCYPCALRRGGAYDELHDRWEEPPGLAGIALPTGQA